VKYVVDASVAVEIVLQSAVGRSAAAMTENAALFAPELLDVEVVSVLRKLILGKRLTAARANEAIEDLRDWDVERVSHRALLETAWTLRNNATAYDAFYLATSRLHDATLLTADGPLSRIPIAGFAIQNLTIV
jgi:predicted nucleic acid-binding protein